MKIPCLLPVLTVLIFSAGCAEKRIAAPAPQYAGVVRQSEDITKTIDMSNADSKEVRKAMNAIHDYNASLRGRTDRFRTLLDRVDYKTSILLQ